MRVYLKALGMKFQRLQLCQTRLKFLVQTVYIPVYSVFYVGGVGSTNGESVNFSYHFMKLLWFHNFDTLSPHPWQLGV